jgi:hypothetical protein
MEIGKLCGVLKICGEKEASDVGTIILCQPQMLDLSPGGGYILF